ncbi:hypothetical protein PP707_05070, partial [Acetobacter pasteurianus]|nr:hypothetical protein [Acetobacter pasteurianus]
FIFGFSHFVFSASSSYMWKPLRSESVTVFLYLSPQKDEAFHFHSTDCGNWPSASNSDSATITSD